MDTDRIVYDNFTYLYDKGDEKRGGVKYVSVKELISYADEVNEEDVLRVLDKWVAAGFVEKEDDLLRLTQDGRKFFKSKYRV